MNKRCTFVILVLALLTVMVWPESASVAAPTTYVEAPITLEAKDILPVKLLRGDNYVIEDRIKNDGLVNTYQLTTNYGPLNVESTAGLMIRISELKAMSSMEEMDRKKVFGDAVVAGVKAPVQGAVKLVKEPVKTTKGVIKGTGRFLSNIGRSLVSDDPYQDNALKVAIGYDAAKRGFAYELGINPYSSYEPAMSMLGRIAQAAVAGGMAPKAAMAAISHDVVTVMRITGTSEGMLKLVRDNPPGELEKINAAKLAEMGIPKSLADAFLRNYVYDPQEQTLLVGELERLKGVKGREEFVAAASTASEKTVSLFFRVMARMMAGYHTHVSPVESIGRIGGTPCLRKKDGSAVLVVPVDFVFRTVEVEAKLNRLDEALQKIGGAPGKELWLSGSVDVRAREMLTASKWKIMEKAGDRLMKE